MDYKSGGKKLDPLLVKNGIQLQLLAYLGALRQWKNPRDFFYAGKIIPSGAFYVNLRGEYKSGGSRAEILTGADESRRLAYRHTEDLTRASWTGSITSRRKISSVIN